MLAWRRGGLSADALKSVTLWPAQIFGVGDKMGSIEVERWPTSS
jgi:imidazolonepropionase-like amidohydrolase